MREVFPAWLNEEFATRFECRARWHAAQRASRVPAASPHPIRPRGYDGLNAIDWQSLFEHCDISGALSQAEIRHPFLDLRVLQYMLALPAMPWCRNKLIIRRSMRGALPRDVLRRKKTTIPVSPDLTRVLASGLPRPVLAPDLLKYVNPGRMTTVPKDSLELRGALRPLGLSYWLQDLAQQPTRGES
jgi:asparagine synthase (glutamine-hydrolysing)